jgi:DNA-binding transcriptional MerR regulator/effector-binding domain-containing protein
MFSIGQFSTASGIPVRTLRFYHDVGLLVPASVDAATNYRSYDERNLENAKVIVALRGLEFSLEEVRQILAECRDDTDVIHQLERQKKTITGKIQHYEKVLSTLNQLMDKERRTREEAKTIATNTAVEERDIEPVLVAGIRMNGSYSDCGKGFAALGKQLGRHIAGKPLCLYYDGEYRDADANFEPCMPIRKQVETNGDVSIRELPAAHCVTVLHHGPYEELKNSYAKILKYVNARGYKVSLPTREVYLKGPGMIFRGNPKKYVTEIQLPVETA